MGRERESCEREMREESLGRPAFLAHTAKSHEARCLSRASLVLTAWKTVGKSPVFSPHWNPKKLPVRMLKYGHRAAPTLKNTGKHAELTFSFFLG